MTDDRSLAEDRADLAAEFALGLLTGDELRAARQLQATNDDFRREVARWRGRLAPLGHEVAPVEPPAALWRSIGERIGGAQDVSNVVQLRKRVHYWRAATGAMTALAACLAIVLLIRPQAPPAPATETRSSAAPLVAMLGNDQQQMKVVASWNPAGRQLVLAVPGDMPADPAHAHELWVIPSGGKPRSLGTMPASKQMHMQLAEALASLLQQGATIAVSVEPPGGSPTGQPTGPVVVSGALTPA